MAYPQWAYPTNYTNGTGVDSVSDFFLGYPTFISGGLSSTTLMIFTFLVFFALGLPFGVGAGLTAASFISFILSTYLWWNGTLGIVFPMVFFTLTVLAAILVGNSKN